MRKTTSWLKFAATAQPNAEMLNIRAAMSMVLLRPMPSESMPATSTPIIEPIRAQPTYQPSWIVLRANWVVTALVVPEITAVSYPNRIPPMAATTARNTTYPILTFSVLAIVI